MEKRVYGSDGRVCYYTGGFMGGSATIPVALLLLYYFWWISCIRRRGAPLILSAVLTIHSRVLQSDKQIIDLTSALLQFCLLSHHSVPLLWYHLVVIGVNSNGLRSPQPGVLVANPSSLWLLSKEVQAVFADWGLQPSRFTFVVYIYIGFCVLYFIISLNLWRAFLYMFPTCQGLAGLSEGLKTWHHQ